MTTTPTLGKPYRRSEDGRWVAPYSIDGRRGVCYGLTRAEAVNKRAAAVERARQGAPVRDSRATLTEYVDRWVSTTLKASGRKESTQALYSGTLRRHVTPALGGTRLADLSAQEVEQALAGLKPSTARTAYAALRAVLATAKRDGLVAVNVVELLHAPRVRRHDAAFLAPADVAALVKAVRGDRMEALYLLLIATGLRRGEALALRWSDIDGTAVHVRQTLGRVEGVGLRFTEPKSTASRRDLTVGPGMAKALSQHRARQAQERLLVGSAWVEHGLVFCTPLGTPCEPRNVLREFQRITKAAGLGSVKLHTLRHSAASTMLANGVDLAAVAEHLGHGSKAVTLGIYSHALPAKREAAAALLDAQIV